MSYTKKPIKSRAVSKVRFCVVPEQELESVCLVGSFNNWDESAMPMKKQKDGSFVTEIELPMGEKHLFRYLGDGEVWFNDGNAEGYEPCGFSGESNCVIWV
ncbi:MAG: isoamylase early set domain-containing protein [Deltaproteobacteria bacterium]|jgi:1,4-alpha-glucan branching enzyme|nr:isoamylase early set domain-containing protein [Deltaproteobacteria bacterium]